MAHCHGVAQDTCCVALSLSPLRAFAMQAKPLLQRVVLLYLPGMSRSLYEEHRAALSHIGALMGKPVTVIAKNAMVHPGESAIRSSHLLGFVCSQRDCTRGCYFSIPNRIKIFIHL